MGRMPPVLHVSLRKLAGGGQHQLFPGPLRHSEQQGPHVLELVPEAVGSAILILRRAGHQPAGQHLIERPAVEIPVQRRLRGGEAQGGHLFPPVQHDLLPLCLRPFRREGVPAVDQPAPFPRRAHQNGRQSLCHRAGGRLSISPLDGQRPSTSGERETEHPLRPVRGHMSLRHQQGLPKPLLPAGKAGAVGHCTGQAIPVREDGGADAPCLQQQPLLPAHGQRVVFPAGEAALSSVSHPKLSPHRI